MNLQVTHISFGLISGSRHPSLTKLSEGLAVEIRKLDTTLTGINQTFSSDYD